MLVNGVTYLPDTEEPVISAIAHDPLYPACSADVEICTDVTDASEISSVKLSWKSASAPSVSVTTDMKNVGGDTYCAYVSYVSAIAADARKIKYHIKATDTHGNYDWEPAGFDMSFTYDCMDPVADANGPYFCDEGSSAVLDASASSDTVDPSLDYAWDLDDDGLYDDATGVSPSFSCVDDSVNDVSVRVTDDAGNTDTADSVVTVNNVIPVAIVSGASTGDEGSDVALTASKTDVGTLDTHTFKWIVGLVETPGDALTVHCVDEELIAVTLEVTDDDFGVGTIAHNVQCENVAPVVDAGADQTVDQGQEVTVTENVSDVGVNDVLTVTYNWGSGFVSESSHTYCVVGDHIVTVRVDDGDLGVTTDTLTVTVENVLPTIVSTGEPYVGIIDDILTFTATGADVCSDALTVKWEFGFGYTTDNTNLWSAPFSGTVGLMITDVYGGVVTADVQVDIYNYKIELDPMCNLISIPLVPESTDIEDVLNGVTPEYVWAYNVNPSTGLNEWSYYSPQAGDLDEMIPGYGYYICMADGDADTLYQNGEKFYDIGIGIPMPPQVELTTGWNLIGHYGMRNVKKSNEVQDLSGGILTDLADITLLGEFAEPDRKLKPTVGYWAFITGQNNLLYAPSQADYKVI